MNNQLKKSQKQQKHDRISNQTIPSVLKRSVANAASDPELRKYVTALLDPFNEEAIGARIPDISNQGTITAKSEGIVTLSSNASGVCSFAVSSNPLFGFKDLTTASTSAGASGMSNLGANAPYIYGPAAQGNLSAEFANCRVVGWGYRLRNQMPPTTAVGRVIWAAVPTNGDVPGFQTVLNLGCFNSTMLGRETGLYFSGSSLVLGAPSSIMAFPHAGELSIQDLIGQALEMVGTICDYKFCDFHTTNTNTPITATSSSGTSVGVTTATNVVTYVDNEDAVNYRGWNTYIVRMEGLPPSTVVAELDYIYHYEGGAPAPLSSVGIVMHDSPSETHVNTAALHRCVDMSVVSKSVRFAEQIFASDFLGAASTVIGKRNSRKVKSFIQQQAMSKLGLVI